MSSYDAEVLAQQLAALGRDLQHEVLVLGELEEAAVDAEGEYRRLDAEYEDRFAQAFLIFEGNIETRKAQARLECIPSRAAVQEASLNWSRAKLKVRMQQANLSALHKRVEIGRSLLSREKALLSLTGVGEV